MQKDAHGIHADTFGPAEFFLDASGVEGGRLPHLQLVDGCGWREIAADELGLLLIPGVGLGRDPAAVLSGQ